jgi:hypothetical protein
VLTMLGSSISRDRPRRYWLDEILMECNPKAPLTDEDRAWASGGPIGRELI